MSNRSGNRGDAGIGGAGAVDSVNGETGVVVLDGSEIDSTITPSNYSAATADIDAHLTGIDTALGALTGVSDGDKGDITVSSSGAVWTIDNGVIDIANLSASGTPSSTTYLRGDNTWATVAASGVPFGVADDSMDGAAITTLFSTYSVVFLKNGTYNLTESINLENTNGNTLIGESQHGVIIKPQNGGTWAQQSVINALGGAVAVNIAANNTTAGTRSITATTPSQVAGVLPGDWFTIKYNRLDGQLDSEHHYVESINYGTGEITTVARLHGTGTSVLFTDISRNGRSHRFSNFTIDMGDLTDGLAVRGLYINNTVDCHVSKIYGYNAQTNNERFIEMNTSPYTIVEDCFFEKCQAEAIRASVSIGSEIRSNVFTEFSLNTDGPGGAGNNSAIQWSYVPSDVKVINNLFMNSDNNGIQMSSVNGAGQRFEIIGNTFKGVLGFALDIAGGGSHTITGNLFSHMANGTFCIRLSSTKSCTVSGNTFDYFGLRGINDVNGTDNNYKNNVFRNAKSRTTGGTLGTCFQSDGSVNCDFDNNVYATDIASANVVAILGAGGGNKYDWDKVRRSISASATTTDKDRDILVDTSSGAVTVTIRSIDITSRAGREWFIKDISGNAGTNNITIVGASGETIDGAASEVISVNRGWVLLRSNGTNLEIIG